MQGFPLLSFLTWLPIAGGIVVLLFGDRGIQAGRIVALVTAVVALLASIPLYTGFDASTFDYQFVERLPWIPALHSTYYLGVDGISMPLILLTTLITVPVILAAWTVIDTRPAQYFAAFLIMEGLMIGVFSARRCAAVLLLLGGHAHPDVPHHRRVGRPAARVRDAQVLPVHLPRQRVHAGRADLHVHADRHAADRSTTPSPRSRRCR